MDTAQECISLNELNRCSSFRKKAAQIDKSRVTCLLGQYVT